ncbi:hypothetical protein RHSIM_Rhsim13G0159200 [Rhododendron simsii]|uniref:Gnk2-homologous domain-containing protein n=1 Tax=Rhododendron simsii TaxID=118357 RepID=A0A834L698_RHOSS|nr:hypothetical protein RHSIM_Rhsim13G0159200 [Rhododendron simsii]
MDNLLPRKALFVYTICLLSLTPITKGDYPPFFSLDCPNTTLSTTSTYAPNSTYKTNLNTLFSTLSSHSNNASNGFYNFTAGTSPPDIAYGLFLCRGDISSAECQDCIVYATRNVLEWCPKSKRVIVWLEGCMLRYSDEYIFARQDRGFVGVLHNVRNVTNETSFNEVLGEVMDDIVNRASSDDSGKKFATAQVNYSPLLTLYGLAQCTPDISDSDCKTCIRDCISTFPSCCDAKQGAIVRLPSCNVSGYMSPEYLINGKFSAKSDVFSFGVLVLEIISGKRNNFYHSDDAANLLSYAWKLWREGTPLDLLDPTLEGSYTRNEVTRCIHIALLCVQDDPDARPSMATIVLMLNSYSTTLPLPQQPRFLGRSGIGSNIIPELQPNQSISRSTQSTVNEASISEVEPR